MTTAGFAPHEIPTGGEAPPLHLEYEDRPDGRRLVVSFSPFVVLITRADGTREPLGRMGVKLIAPGDSVGLPLSATAAVDSKLVYQTRVEGVLQYTADHAPLFIDDAEAMEEYQRAPPERWWWYRRETEDGLVLHLHPASSNARVSVSVRGDMGFQGSWCYADHGDGWRAVMGWNGWGDPPDGWHRHLETARRRKDGTAATEYWLAYEAPGNRRPREGA